MKPLKIHLKLTKERKPRVQYWDIFDGKIRVGHVMVKPSLNEALGEHFSIDLHINQRMRGKGIGRVAYRQASEKSGHAVIYAHMRKSNYASIKAAEAAGYEVCPIEGELQLTMKWQAKASM